MTSLHSLRTGEIFRFRKDAWSLVINSAHLQSGAAQATTVTKSSGSLVYVYKFTSFTVQTIYRIAPGWNFITKSVRIIRAPQRQFIVHAVDSIALSLASAPNSIYTPGAYLPQMGMGPAKSRASTGTARFAAFLRYPHKHGLMLTVQNPFLRVLHRGSEIKIGYRPDMLWKQSWGDFRTDPAIIGPYVQTGRYEPRQMRLEWQQKGARSPIKGMDRGEVKALTAAVSDFLIAPTPRPISVEVGWTLNDYQINVGTPKGRRAYKHIIDATSALGIPYLVYGPSDTKLANIKEDTDSWHWGHILWLDLGQQIRKGEWKPDRSSLPPEVVDMLKYARTKHVGLLAYVYPSIPFSGNPSWIVKTGGYQYSTLASRSFQNHLIHDLIAFKRRTGIAGYSFDYAYLNLPGSSAYAQWWGWRRVLENLKKACPGIVIDGRQTYQEYGPWTWLAGNYPHPTGNDEQPESFVPYPDLHFDRVSADRMRFVNYWYRNYQFTPETIMPGFAFHQTERSINITGAHGTIEPRLIQTSFRTRDWDQLGFRYSLLSSIATAGWNNVINMIPARDPQEVRAFRRSDLQWIRHWLKWTQTHRKYLRQTRTILGQPAMGKADGTSMVVGDRGYIFLFNPNYKRLTVSLALNNSIGLTDRTTYLLKELYPIAGDLIGNPVSGFWRYDQTVQLHLRGTSATVLKLEPYHESTAPIIFNAQAGPLKPSALINNHSVQLHNISGEPGTDSMVSLLLPKYRDIKSFNVNGLPFPFKQHGKYIYTHLHFRGIRFTQAQQIALTKSGPGQLNGTFIIPERVFKQLAARKHSWPLHWTKNNYKTTWLVPERLLLFAQFAEPNSMDKVSVSIDGRRIALRHAYSSVRVHAASFVGWYADLTDLKPDIRYHLVIHIPPGSEARFQGLFFDNVRPFWTKQVAR